MSAERTRTSPARRGVAGSRRRRGWRSNSSGATARNTKIGNRAGFVASPQGAAGVSVIVTPRSFALAQPRPSPTLPPPSLRCPDRFAPSGTARLADGPAS
eukprot:184223-Chlamydomonas_euryale.AAC.1